VIATILRRWRLFVAVLVGFVVLVAMLTLVTPKSYTTTTRLIAGNPTQDSAPDNTTLPILNALVLQNGAQSAETLATLAQQEDVADTVAKQLQLSVSPGALLSHVSVKPITNTAILELSVSWNNRTDSARIANAFAQAFIWQDRELVRSQATTAISFLSTEVPRAQTAMQQSAADLANFQATHGFVDSNTHTQDLVSRATGLDGKIQTTQLDAREAHALLDNVARQLSSVPASVNTAQQITINPVLTDLRTKLEQVEIQLQTARQQYTEQHPEVIALVKQRQELQAQIAREPTQINSANTLSPNPLFQLLQQQEAQYRQRIDGDTAQLALLQRERASMAPVLRGLPRQSMELGALQQRAKLAADVYNALQQKYNDATIARSTAISDISVVQPATADAASVRPNLRVNILAALVVGMLLAGIVVFVVDMFQRTVRETSNDPGILGLPILARIPALNTTNTKMLPWLHSMTAEAFLHLCIALKLRSAQQIRTLAITSPTRGDGKSTVAFNLAKAMANLQHRVLLIDGDLRRPTLHTLAGCSNEAGLTTFLQGSDSFWPTVHEISPTFHLLPAGPPVENPVALLQFLSFDDILRDPEGRYSMIIVDTPPLSAVTDGILLSAKAEAAALVVAVNSTDERETRDAMARFTALGVNNLLGVILNKDPKRVSDYSDYFSQEHSPALRGAP
jgi:capsular exopolysaccharide synthesis family protein